MLYLSTRISGMSSGPDRAEIRKSEQDRSEEGRILYSDSDGQPTFRRSVTSFLDILGTKVALTNMKEADLHDQIQLLDRLNGALHDSAWEGEWQRMLTFSDSIALAVPLQPGSHGIELAGTIDHIAAYQLELALAGRFLRGGIAIGDAYADYANITGPALVEAADLEANVAVVPRVLISDTTLRLVLQESWDSYGARSYQSEWNSGVMIDADSRAFVNYLNAALNAEADGVAEAADLLENHKKTVSDALAKHSGNPRIREKYVWVAHYHNAFCELRSLDECLQIDKPHLSPLEVLYPRSIRRLLERDGPVGPDAPV